MADSPFVKLITLIFDSAPGGMTIRLPYVDHSVNPPEEKVIPFRIGSQDKEDLIAVLKRAANKQELENGNPMPFNEAAFYPDVDGEIRKRITREVSRMLADIQDEPKASERANILKQVRLTMKQIQPDVKLSNMEFKKLRAAFKKVNPEISDDEIVALFS